MHRGLFGNCRSGKNSFDENVDEKGEMISDKGGTRLTYLFFFLYKFKIYPRDKIFLFEFDCYLEEETENAHLHESMLELTIEDNKFPEWNFFFFLYTTSKKFDSIQNEIQCFPFKYSNFPISKFYL